MVVGLDGYGRWGVGIIILGGGDDGGGEKKESFPVMNDLQYSIVCQAGGKIARSIVVQTPVCVQVALHYNGSSEFIAAEGIAEIGGPDGLVVDDFLRRSFGEFVAFVHDDRPVANPQGLGHFVLGDQHALAKLLLEAANFLLQIFHGDRIDAGERLVKQDQLGLSAQGAGDLEFSTLAAGESFGLLVADLQQAVLIEQDFGPFVALRTGEDLMSPGSPEDFARRLDGESRSVPVTDNRFPAEPACTWGVG